jgi:hypothetical protein
MNVLFLSKWSPFFFKRKLNSWKKRYLLFKISTKSFHEKRTVAFFLSILYSKDTFCYYELCINWKFTLLTFFYPLSRRKQAHRIITFFCYFYTVWLLKKTLKEIYYSCRSFDYNFILRFSLWMFLKVFEIHKLKKYI